MHDKVNFELQTLYRKSSEYRIAHGRAGRHNGKMADSLSFMILSLSTLAGMLLFMVRII